MDRRPSLLIVSLLALLLVPACARVGPPTGGDSTT